MWVSPNTFPKIETEEPYPMLNDMQWRNANTYTKSKRHQYHSPWVKIWRYSHAGPYTNAFRIARRNSRRFQVQRYEDYFIRKNIFRQC